MNKLLKQVLIVGVLVFFYGKANADSFSDAFHAYDTKHYAKAAKLFKPLAEAGDARAQELLGTQYLMGKGVAKDLNQAEKWFRLSAEQGNTIAQTQLGIMFYYGNGVNKNYDEAMKWCRLAAEQGNPISQYLVGEMTSDQLEGTRWFRMAAEQGYADAQVQLGGWYGLWGPIACAVEGRNKNGQDCPKEYEDPVESLKWYRLAAAQNNATAQLNVGVAYEEGRVVAKDYQEAIKWYRLSAEQGDSRAQEWLGKAYAEGMDMPQDYVMAYMWLNLAVVGADDYLFSKAFKSRSSIVALRDAIAKKMTAQQIGEAQDLSRKCMARKYKGC